MWDVIDKLVEWAKDECAAARNWGFDEWVVPVDCNDIAVYFQRTGDGNNYMATAYRTDRDGAEDLDGPRIVLGKVGQPGGSLS